MKHLVMSKFIVSFFSLAFAIIVCGNYGYANVKKKEIRQIETKKDVKKKELEKKELIKDKK